MQGGGRLCTMNIGVAMSGCDIEVWDRRDAPKIFLIADSCIFPNEIKTFVRFELHVWCVAAENFKESSLWAH